MQMHESDVNNLDEVVHELGIENSFMRPAEAVRELKAEIERLQAALKPFAALLDRRWINKEDSIATVRAGGFVSELQAVELKHVLKAHDLLYAVEQQVPEK